MHQNLGLSLESALFEKRILDTVVLTCYENERPLQGLAGIADWNFYGRISQYIRMGAFTGKIGECVFMPMRKNRFLYQILLIGAGSNSKPGERLPLDQKIIHILNKSIQGLKITKLGLSLSDFGLSDSDKAEGKAEKALKGVELCLLD